MDSLSLDSASPLSSNAATAHAPTQRQRIVDSLMATPAGFETSTSLSREALGEAVTRINDVLRPRGLEFDISEESSRIITRVIDRETREVIRQIPGEEVLAVLRRFEEIQSGLVSLKA